MLTSRMQLAHCQRLDPWVGDEIAATVSPWLLQY
jgi:hypothetical protein